MELIDRKALDAAFTMLRFDKDGNLAHWDDRKNWCMHGSEVEALISGAPTVDAVPIKPLCEWLAGYAAPPRYALEAVIHDIDPASIAYTVNDRAKAWEYAIKEMLESGLLKDADKWNDLCKMPRMCHDCPYWEVCEPPYICAETEAKYRGKDKQEATK